jgi:hypothetical protein
MQNIKHIKISDEFSTTPKGRENPKDGQYTGQRFREEFIQPYFEVVDKFIIDLDDLYGCPSSFREEAFGGLARIYGKKKVLEKLEFICTDEPPLVEIIKKDIENANKK